MADDGIQDRVPAVLEVAQNGVWVDDRYYTDTDLTFKEQRVVRELIREACDDPSMKYQDAEWMDVWPALVTVLKRRTDTKFSYDQAADMKYDDIVKPPEEKPKKLSEVKHPQQVSS
jgi:hypothetical protein